MEKKKEKPEDLDREITEENVEEFVQIALKKYHEKNFLADFYFWRCALPLLKKKWKKDLSKKLAGEIIVAIATTNMEE